MPSSTTPRPTRTTTTHTPTAAAKKAAPTARKTATSRTATAKAAPVKANGSRAVTTTAPAEAAPRKAAPRKAAPRKTAPRKAAPRPTAPGEAAPVAPVQRLAPAPQQQPAPAPTSTPAPVRNRAGGAIARGAAVSALLVLGWFVLAVVVVLGLFALALNAFNNGAGVAGGKLGIFAVVVALAIGRAVFAIEKRGEDVETGVLVTREQQPQLWAVIDEVAAETGLPRPDDLRLVEDVNAFVHQDTRLLGLVAGERHMAIGLGLVNVLDVDELRAVVAHELGHYGGGDTRFSALVYRSEVTMVRTVRHLGARSVLGRVFAAYAGVYHRTSFSTRRAQELRADEASVLVAGREAQASLLRELQSAAPSWSFFLDRYAAPLWRAGLAPDDLYTGFRALYAAPARQAELDRLRAEDGRPADRYDSHPSVSERLAHAGATPDRTRRGDTRPARDLLVDAPAVEAAVTRWFTSAVVTSPLRQVGWDDQDVAAAYGAVADRNAAALAEATAALDGLTGPAGLGRTLELLEAGRDGELVTLLTKDRRDLGADARAQELRWLVGRLLRDSAHTALAGTGRTSWRVAWDGDVQLVGTRGRVVDVGPALLEALVRDGVPGLRPVLVKAKVDLGAAATPQATVLTERFVTVLPGLTQRRPLAKKLLSVYGPTTDLVLTTERVVAVPTPELSFVQQAQLAFARQYGLFGASVDSRRRAELQALSEVPLDALGPQPGQRAWLWDDLDGVVLSSGDKREWAISLRPSDGSKQTFTSRKTVSQTSGPVAERLERLVGDRLTRA